MGFSTIGAGVILFIGMMFFASTVLSATFDGQRSVSDAVRDDRQRDRFVRDTDVEITQSTLNATALVLEIENTGGTTLDPELTGVLLDGTWVQAGDIDRSVDSRTQTTVWAPGETLTLDISFSSSPNRAFVVLETGKGLLWTP